MSRASGTGRIAGVGCPHHSTLGAAGGTAAHRFRTIVPGARIALAFVIERLRNGFSLPEQIEAASGCR
jgi:hypothetical protein